MKARYIKRMWQRKYNNTIQGRRLRRIASRLHKYQEYAEFCMNPERTPFNNWDEIIAHLRYVFLVEFKNFLFKKDIKHGLKMWFRYHIEEAEYWQSPKWSYYDNFRGHLCMRLKIYQKRAWGNE